MAGQRMYYSNVLTTARGAVRGTIAFYVASGNAPSVITGRGFSVAGSGATSLFTVYFPERFGTNTITLLDASFVSGTTQLCDVMITGGYSVPTVTSQASCIQLQTVYASTAAALATPKGTCYFEFEAELGM